MKFDIPGGIGPVEARYFPLSLLPLVEGIHVLDGILARYRREEDGGRVGRALLPGDQDRRVCIED